MFNRRLGDVTNPKYGHLNDEQYHEFIIFYITMTPHYPVAAIKTKIHSSSLDTHVLQYGISY